MPRTDYWRLADVVIDGHQGPQPTVRPGESYDLDVILTADSDSPSGAWPGYIERYQSLLEYGRRAGEFVTHTIEGGRVAYTETHDNNVPNETLVVALRPPDDTQTGRAGWYLVEAVEDQTSLPSALCQFTMSLVYLAPYGTGTNAYDQRYEVESALEAPTLI